MENFEGGKQIVVMADNEKSTYKGWSGKVSLKW